VLSISAHNSEKLKCTGFNSPPPPPELAFQFIYSSMGFTGISNYANSMIVYIIDILMKRRLLDALEI
jgi:hypothetical protein